MNNGKNLSDFWRYDRSTDQVLELASVLQGADILIGNMGSGIRVTWSGEEVSYTDFQRRMVALDFGPLRDQKCPFPGAAVDEVIGYAAHEGGHSLWSCAGKDQDIERETQARWDSLPPALQRAWQDDQPETLTELCRIQNILEDAYVDHCVAQRWPVLGEYIHIARRRLEERADYDMKAVALPPTRFGGCPGRNAILNLWVAVSLNKNPLCPEMSAPVRRAMEELLALTQKAVAEPKAVVRHTMAVEAAIILWTQFPVGEAPIPTHPEAAFKESATQEGEATDDAPRPHSEPARAKNLDDFDPRPRQGQGGREVIPVPMKLLEQVAKASSQGREDLSASVAHALAEDPRSVAARTKTARYDPERASQVISQARPEAQAVRQAFRHLQYLKTRWLHGLDRGKLDEGSLWKPFVGDPGYYKRRDAVGKPSLAIGLLLDVSGSMGRYKAIVERTAAVFFEGLRQMPDIDFAAWGYTGQGASVMLTRLCDRQLSRLCLGDVDQGGSTPSGAALAGAKILLDQMPEKRKLLLHFTDGKPDSPAHVLKAVQSCRDAGIQVYAIGLPQHGQMLVHQYGEGNCKTIQTVAELPQAVAQLVRKLGTYQR